MTLEEGEVFADYTVLRFIGAGGMGEVYLAQHPRLPGRRDALKLLGRDISADKDFRGRFLREADLASTLSHQHIVGITDRGEDGGQLWIAMDYIDGEDAAQLLRRCYPGGMPISLVAAIVSAVGSALDYAHSKGLLHRDVKPANILLANADDDAQRRILLSDFGIARALDDISDLTPTNTTLGTVAYSAPEQLMGQELDGRADQYALAATAFQLLTGTTMFPASNAAVVIGHHLNADPPQLAATHPELAMLDPVLRAALAKSPRNRFPSCSDFSAAFAEQAKADALEPSAPTAPAPIARGDADPKSPPSGSATTAPATGVRNSRLMALIAAALVMLIAALVWWPWNHRTEPIPAPTAESGTTVTSTAVPPPPAAAITTMTVSTPATVKGSAVDSILLTPNEIRTATRGVFGGLYGADMVVKASSYGMVDNSAQVDPPMCVGVLFGNDHSIYGDSGFDAIRDQTLTPTNYTNDTSVEQTVAVFPDAAAAQASSDSQIRRWHTCYLHKPTDETYAEPYTVQVGQRYGEGGIAWTLSDASRSERAAVMRMVGYDNESGYHAGCQVALRSKANVVVWVRACRSVDSQPVLTDLSYANGDYAQQLVDAMIDKVDT